MGSGPHSLKRKKKRSQKRSKKRSKSIKEKSKKLKRRHDSVSCSDDDNSASASSISRSDSSSEDDYRSRRRARSCERRDTRKGSKKRTKRGCSMSDGSGDSRIIKKRKRSKRKRDFDSRKKCHGKKPRREPSSSFSDQSRTCSMSESGDDNNREARKEEKWEMKEKDWGEKGREKIRSKRSRDTSRSCSPCSLRSENHSYGDEERVMEENPPKRLKSVIVVLREIEEVEIGKKNGDEHKDEIVYEADDYPTRSNDSNDGMTRGEALQNREAGSSDFGASEFSRIRRLDVETTGWVASSSIEFVAGDHSKGNRSEVSTADASSKSVDLEAMLRQKALQNLLKRKGKLPTKADGSNKGDHHIEAKNPDGEGSSASVREVGKNDDVKRTSSVTGPQKDTVVHSPIKKLETGHPLEKAYAFANPIIGRPKLDLSTSTRRLLGRSNTWRRDPTSQGSPQPNLLSPKDTVNNKDSAKGIESQSSDTKTVVENTDISAACEPPASVGKSTKDEANEADDESNFEQKTMTVMRGGELVQVSYKVKIPKKAPALARRQLKR